MNRIAGESESTDPPPGAAMGRWRMGGLTRLIRATTGVICLAAYGLSLAAFVAWLLVTARAVMNFPFSSGKDVIHQLLQSIELLLIVPIPSVIGVVVFQTMVQVADPVNPRLEHSHEQVAIAKKLLAGLLVTITGTTLLDLLIVGIYEPEAFLGGFVLIAGLSLYVWILQRGSPPPTPPTPR